MTAKSFERWFAETPDDFMFALKANRFATNRRVLAEAGESIGRFVGSGLARLEHKLGPVLWQFADHKKFEPDDFEAFLKLLPEDVEGRVLRHVLDVRNDTFMTPEFLALARKYRAAVVFTDSPKFPSFANLTTDFVYLRLMNAQSDVPTGYTPDRCSPRSPRARRPGPTAASRPGCRWSPGDAGAPAGASRDVFMFMINGAKERAPAAARWT